MTSEKLGINQDFQNWAKRYSIKTIENEEVHEGYYDEIMESIFNCLVDYDSSKAVSGLIATEETYEMEMGDSPENYLEGCIDDGLDLLPGTPWKIESVNSNDDWQTANVSLVNKEGQSYKYSIKDVEDSDWISSGFFEELEKFSSRKCDLTLIQLPIDAFYKLAAIPHQASKDLSEIIDKYVESYY